jgi:hypothetical protein
MMSLAEAGLSERGAANYEPGSVRYRYAAVYGNPWDAETNPNGFINLGVSENVGVYLLQSVLGRFEIIKIGDGFN